MSAAPELRPGSPEEAGLAAADVARVVPAAAAFLDGAGPDGAFPGFVLLAARHGVVVAYEARGHAVRYGGPEPVPMRRDTVFDLASLSKPFTATVAAALAERGVLDLDGPVGRWLPAGRGPLAGVPLWRLLTHTAGLPPTLDLRPYHGPAAWLEAIAALPPHYPPGRGYAYSDLGPVLLGAVLERVAGRPLDELVAELVTGPLGLRDTGYRPGPALRERVAATEVQPGRGLVRGEVHDENAHHLGGVAGHAGVFGTAWDLAVLGQTFLGGGRYGRVRLLGEAWARRMVTDHNAALGLGARAARGLGWQLDQADFMGALASPTAFGHTGFTGTSLVADPATGVLLVLLTNRVHPARSRGTGSGYRRAPADELARALAAGR